MGNMNIVDRKANKIDLIACMFYDSLLKAFVLMKGKGSLIPIKSTKQ